MPEGDASNRRSEFRLPTPAERLLVEIGGLEMAATLRDITASGMMVESDLLPSRGDRITAHSSMFGSVGGEVRWTGGGRFGVLFDTQLANIDRIRAALAG